MSDLKRIVQLAEQMVKQQSDLDYLEESVKKAKAALLKTQTEDLPMLMAEVGLSEVKLDDGTRIVVEQDVKCGITQANRDAAIRWLVENNFGGLIKTTVVVEFNRGAHDDAINVCDQLAERYENVSLKEDVHAATLKAFVKEQLAASQSIPMDLFGVFPYNVAKMKKGK